MVSDAIVLLRRTLSFELIAHCVCRVFIVCMYCLYPMTTLLLCAVPLTTIYEINFNSIFKKANSHSNEMCEMHVEFWVA